MKTSKGIGEWKDRGRPEKVENKKEILSLRGKCLSEYCEEGEERGCRSEETHPLTTVGRTASGL